MDWSYSNVLVLSIHEEKGTSNISPNPTLGLLSAKNCAHDRSKPSPTTQQQDPNSTTIENNNTTTAVPASMNDGREVNTRMPANGRN
jgi:hypothetical protein